MVFERIWALEGWKWDMGWETVIEPHLDISGHEVGHYWAWLRGCMGF